MNTLKPDSDGPSKEFIHPDSATAAPMTMSSAEATVDKVALDAMIAAPASNDLVKIAVLISASS
jgi:hypothetical protein